MLVSFEELAVASVSKGQENPTPATGGRLSPGVSVSPGERKTMTVTPLQQATRIPKVPGKNWVVASKNERNWSTQVLCEGESREGGGFPVGGLALCVKTLSGNSPWHHLPVCQYLAAEVSRPRALVLSLMRMLSMGASAGSWLILGDLCLPGLPWTELLRPGPASWAMKALLWMTSPLTGFRLCLFPGETVP